MVDPQYHKTYIKRVFYNKNRLRWEAYPGYKLFPIEKVYHIDNKKYIVNAFKIEECEKIIVNTQKKYSRNDPCYCGSSKKYKKCCMK